jgi:hypothetical protein
VSNEVLSEIAYQTALRALDVQERGVEQLRARAGTLLAASSVTASFLGAQTIQRTGELGTLGALALASRGFDPRVPRHPLRVSRTQRPVAVSDH